MKKKAPKQPLQPLIKDPHGTVRFHSKAVVRRLLEESRKRGFGFAACPGRSHD